MALPPRRLGRGPTRRWGLTLRVAGSLGKIPLLVPGLPTCTGDHPSGLPPVDSMRPSAAKGDSQAEVIRELRPGSRHSGPRRTARRTGSWGGGPDTKGVTATVGATRQPGLTGLEASGGRSQGTPRPSPPALGQSAGLRPGASRGSLVYQLQTHFYRRPAAASLTAPQPHTTGTLAARQLSE